MELLVSAGEASGDLHASRLMSELSMLRSEVRFFGLGGDEMLAYGLDPVEHSSDIAVVGLTEALAVLPRARRVFYRLLDEARRRRPAAALLVDSPDFNLRLASRLRRLGIPVLYYVSPQLWAWRAGRVRRIERDVDEMLVLFPFEVEFYRRHGVEVAHVGHPLVDEVPSRLPTAWDGETGRPPAPRIALLPGSRRSEVRALLPAMLDAAAELERSHGARSRLMLAPALSPADVEPYLRQSEADVELVVDGRHEAIADSHLALCASGTATLEVGLLGTPLIVCYRVGRITYALGKRLVRVPHVALVNLVAGEKVAPELLQDRVTGAVLASEAGTLIDDRCRIDEMIERLSRVRPALGQPGASARAAREVDRFLDRLVSDPGGDGCAA